MAWGIDSCNGNRIEWRMGTSFFTISHHIAIGRSTFHYSEIEYSVLVHGSTVHADGTIDDCHSQLASGKKLRTYS
jgi:hypothetical protein